MALRWFQQAACDVAVVEVGLGGTLDATNVVDPTVSVITQLDFEHTAILGTTMTEIAGNKAGIIKPGRPVVSAAQSDDGLRVIQERAAACNAPLLVAGRDWTVTSTDQSFSAYGPWGTLDDLHSALAGHHQVENAGLAIAALHALRTSDTRLPGGDDAAIRAGLGTMRHPARFERVTLDSGQVVVIDGAHSPSSTSALTATMRDHYPDAPVTIVTGMLSDKDPATVLSPLLGIASHWIAVTPMNPRALPNADVKTAIESLGAACTAWPSVAQGIRAAQDLDTPIILVTGSLATAAEARSVLGLV